MGWGLLAALLGITPASGMADEVKLISGLDYSSGRYGAAEATRIWAWPLTIKYERQGFTWKLAAAYLRMSAPAGTTSSGGDVTPGSGSRVVQEGWGDWVAGVTWSAWEQPHHGLLLDLGAKVKLGTGSVAKGLSNGATDYSLFADLYLPLGRLTPFATVGYRWPGAPDGLDPHNTWFGSLGINWKAGDRDHLGLMLDAREPTYAGGDARQEATAYWSHKLAPSAKLQGYLVRGEGRASPDWGAGLLLIYSP